MAGNIEFYSALFAGLLSFVSPCVLPLVPPYLCYLAGVSLDQLTDDRDMIDVQERARVQKRVFVNAILFVLGFTTVFVSLGAGASTIGFFVRSHLDVLSTIAGLAIILMGMHFLGILKIGMLYRELRFQTGGVAVAVPAGGGGETSIAASGGGSYIMGLAFAFGWTPCIGPILGAILAVAGSQESVGQGALLLAVYSLGLGIPFLLAAFFVKPFMNFLARFRRHLGMVEKAMGVLLILTGILFLTGGMQTMSFWLLEKFPTLGAYG
jgi:cytochrome c-type biogenesis protein